ncbi:MAG: hypothetical protein C3F13_01655 [Anaerolineales bacterium]|nr:MAG: hypothetical protein C3F13_01655 [Anaerolineales bacterium]
MFLAYQAHGPGGKGGGAYKISTLVKGASIRVNIGVSFYEDESSSMGGKPCYRALAGKPYAIARKNRMGFIGQIRLCKLFQAYLPINLVHSLQHIGLDEILYLADLSPLARSVLID